MKEKRKVYSAPAAELILLAPMEALALTDDERALNQWNKPVLDNASLQGGNELYWDKSGKFITNS